MREVRAICIGYGEGLPDITILTRGKRGDDYKTLTFPSGLPLNRGQIIKFIAESYGIPPGDVAWAAHVKIPKEK